MDLFDYLRVLSRQWVTIVILALLGAGVGALGTQIATPQFRATSTLFISLQGRADATHLTLGNGFTQARVKSYSLVATSPLVLGKVVKALRLNMTPQQLSGKIKVTVRPDAVLVWLTVTDSRRDVVAGISNAVAERFAQVISDLERPPGVERSPVRVTLVEPASAPSVPSSPRPAVNLALGLLVGLSLGTGLAVAKEFRDRSVSTPQALSDFLAGVGGPPVLSTIIHDPKAARHPMATGDDMRGPRAEGFRRLGTNLRFVEADRHPKVIAVTSALHGEGKTDVAANLAATLAKSGASVCLVDTDLRRPNIARTLDLVQGAGLTTVLIGKAEVPQVLQSTGSFSVLTSGSVPPNPSELLGSARTRSVLTSLAEKFDHVVVDAAPVLPVTDAAVISSVVDGYLLVVRASSTRREQVGEALRVLRHVGAPVLGAILNAAPPKENVDILGRGYDWRPLQCRTTRRFFGLRGLVRDGQVRIIPQFHHTRADDGQLCSVASEASAQR
ncbi:polysaccharide biosynthesis tyrosine autokinase [Streptomyces sp. NPDC052107]|uniref:polysaccharide biosynthesis tyrosine autokinase n=1 Tax=Streptomyces sp. NPDC052107 TaxID=3155632 RepID=UPI00342B4200